MERGREMKLFQDKKYVSEQELKALYNIDIECLRYRKEHGLIPDKYMKVFRVEGLKYDIMYDVNVLPYLDGTYSAYELRKQQRIRLLRQEGILSTWTDPVKDYILLNEAAKRLNYSVSSLLYRFKRYPDIYNPYILIFANNTYIDAKLVTDWGKLEEDIQKEKYQVYTVDTDGK